MHGVMVHALFYGDRHYCRYERKERRDLQRFLLKEELPDAGIPYPYAGPGKDQPQKERGDALQALVPVRMLLPLRRLRRQMISLLWKRIKLLVLCGPGLSEVGITF